MNTSKLIDKIKYIPPVFDADLKDYLSYLNARSINNESLRDNRSEINKKSKPRAKFGELSGFITYMSEDFDASLEDFKDYM